MVINAIVQTQAKIQEGNMKNYLISGKFREILIRLIDNPFGETPLSELYDVIPFVDGEQEVFIEDGHCFVRHTNTYATFFNTDEKTIDNYELIRRIVVRYNIELQGQDERSKRYFVDEIKALLLKTK